MPAKAPAPVSKAVVAKARQLLDFIAARIHPVERLHELSRVLSTANSPSNATLEDYRWQMDQLVGDTMEYAYAGPRLAGYRLAMESRLACHTIDGVAARHRCTPGAGH